MKQVFEELQARIKEVSEVKYIDLYRNQYNESEKNHPHDFPAILLHFDSMSFVSYTTGVQLCNCLLRVLLAVEKYSDFYEGSENQSNALGIFEIHDKVYQKLQGFAGSDNETTVIASPMRRVSEVQDTSYTHLYVFVMEFELSFWDTSGSSLNDYAPVNLDYKINKLDNI